MKFPEISTWTSLSLLILLIAPMLAACAPSDKGEGEAVSKVKRETSPDVDASEVDVLVNGNTTFAFNLYESMKTEEGNLFASPYSISLALAMTYAGARGVTAEEMAAALNFGLDQDRLHPAFNALDLELVKRSEPVKTPDGELDGFQLEIANSLWGQKDYTFLPEFLDLLALNYGAGMQLVDFAGATEEARLAINAWVEENTQGKIVDLIPQGILNELSRLVLANAIYFKASWLYPFMEENTVDTPFNLLDGTTVSVPMMRQSSNFLYGEGRGYQLIELPYLGNQVAMDVLLPGEGSFKAVEDSLSAEWLLQALDDMGFVEVTLGMPRFEFVSSFKLSDVLKAMGMPTAFGMDADLSGMDGTEELFIKEVLHKAFVAVDEEGTEAAAATAVIIALKGAMVEPVQMRVDRPFFFFIRDIPTGTILFMGRVLDPSVQK